MPSTYIDSEGIPRKRCPRCGLILTPDLFHKNKSTPDGLFRWCKECAKENAKKFYHKNPERHKEINKIWRSRDPITFMLAQWQSGAISRRHPSSIGHSHLLGLLKSQRGLCYWTGRLMTHTIPAPAPNTNISVDRVDPEIGYHPGNVVLCCSAVNQMKRDMTPEQFISMCQEVSNHAGPVRTNSRLIH